jgi:hypothetical protein
MTEKQVIAMFDKAFGFEPKETTAPETRPFYMVYVEGASTPKVKHADLQQARKEAERLANKVGKPAYLLHATDVCLPDPRWDVLELVDKAKKLGHDDIASVLYACYALAVTSAHLVPEEGEFGKLWFEIANSLK